MPKILLRIQFYHIVQSYLVNNGVMDIAERLGHSREMVENYYFSYVSWKAKQNEKIARLNGLCGVKSILKIFYLK